VKREKLHKSFVGDFEDYDPRIIQGATDEANVLTGPTIFSIAKHIAKIWHSKHVITYASGMNAYQLGHWVDSHKRHQRNPTYPLEDDAWRYDSTIGVFALLFEFSLYERMHATPECMKMLYAQLDTLGYTRSGIQYTVQGRRKSGDPNTTLGNTLVNGLSHLFEFALHMANHSDDYDTVLDVDPRDVPMRAIVMGDDWLGATQTPYQDMDFELEPAMLKLGFVSQVKVPSCWEVASFCSGYFYPAQYPTGVDNINAHCLVYGPKIGRTLAKFGFSIGYQPDKDAWNRGVLQCLNSNCNHIPFLVDIIRRLRKIVPTGRHVIISPDQKFKFNVDRSYEVDDAVWRMMDLLYGLGPADLESWRKAILDIKSLPASFHHPALATIVARDL